MIKEFRGKKIELNDELVKTFEEFMHEEVDDDLIEIYIDSSIKEVSTQNIEKLSEKELTKIIEKWLTTELECHGFVKP